MDRAKSWRKKEVAPPPRQGKKKKAAAATVFKKAQPKKRQPRKGIGCMRAGPPLKRKKKVPHVEGAGFYSWSRQALGMSKTREGENLEKTFKEFEKNKWPEMSAFLRRQATALLDEVAETKGGAAMQEGFVSDSRLRRLMRSALSPETTLVFFGDMAALLVMLIGSDDVVDTVNRMSVYVSPDRTGFSAATFCANLESVVGLPDYKYKRDAKHRDAPPVKATVVRVIPSLMSRYRKIFDDLDKNMHEYQKGFFPRAVTETVIEGDAKLAENRAMHLNIFVPDWSEDLTESAVRHMADPIRRALLKKEKLTAAFHLPLNQFDLARDFINAAIGSEYMKNARSPSSNLILRAKGGGSVTVLRRVYKTSCCLIFGINTELLYDCFHEGNLQHLNSAILTTMYDFKLKTFVPSEALRRRSQEEKAAEKGEEKKGEEKASGIGSMSIVRRYSRMNNINDPVRQNMFKEHGLPLVVIEELQRRGLVFEYTEPKHRAQTPREWSTFLSKLSVVNAEHVAIDMLNHLSTASTGFDSLLEINALDGVSGAVLGATCDHVCVVPHPSRWRDLREVQKFRQAFDIVSKSTRAAIHPVRSYEVGVPASLRSSHGIFSRAGVEYIVKKGCAYNFLHLDWQADITGNDVEPNIGWVSKILRGLYTESPNKSTVFSFILKLSRTLTTLQVDGGVDRDGNPRPTATLATAGILSPERLKYLRFRGGEPDKATGKPMPMPISQYIGLLNRQRALKGLWYPHATVYNELLRFYEMDTNSNLGKEPPQVVFAHEFGSIAIITAVTGPVVEHASSTEHLIYASGNYNRKVTIYAAPPKRLAKLQADGRPLFYSFDDEQRKRRQDWVARFKAGNNIPDKDAEKDLKKAKDLAPGGRESKEFKAAMARVPMRKTEDGELVREHDLDDVDNHEGYLGMYEALEPSDEEILEYNRRYRPSREEVVKQNADEKERRRDKKKARKKTKHAERMLYEEARANFTKNMKRPEPKEPERRPARIVVVHAPDKAKEKDHSELDHKHGGGHSLLGSSGRDEDAEEDPRPTPEEARREAQRLYELEAKHEKEKEEWNRKDSEMEDLLKASEMRDAPAPSGRSLLGPRSRVEEDVQNMLNNRIVKDDRPRKAAGPPVPTPTPVPYGGIGDAAFSSPLRATASVFVPTILRPPPIPGPCPPSMVPLDRLGASSILVDDKAFFSKLGKELALTPTGISEFNEAAAALLALTADSDTPVTRGDPEVANLADRVMCHKAISPGLGYLDCVRACASSSRKYVVLRGAHFKRTIKFIKDILVDIPLEAVLARNPGKWSEPSIAELKRQQTFVGLYSAWKGLCTTCETECGVKPSVSNPLIWVPLGDENQMKELQKKAREKTFTPTNRDAMQFRMACMDAPLDTANLEVRRKRLEEASILSVMPPGWTADTQMTWWHWHRIFLVAQERIQQATATPSV